MPFLQHMYDFERINEVAVQQMFIKALVPLLVTEDPTGWNASMYIDGSIIHIEPQMHDILQ